MIPIETLDDELLLLIKLGLPNPSDFKLCGLIEIEKDNNWYSNKAIIEYNDKRYLKAGSFIISASLYMYTQYAVIYNEERGETELITVNSILRGVI